MGKWWRWFYNRLRVPVDKSRADTVSLKDSTLERVFFLQQHPWFCDIPFDLLWSLRSHLEVGYYQHGEVIFTEGDQGQYIYIIVYGRVQIIKSWRQPQAQRLATLEGGDFFGEMGIFEGMPHSATAVVEEETEVLLLPAEILQDLIQHHPAIISAIGRALSMRVHHTTRTRQWQKR